MSFPTFWLLEKISFMLHHLYPKGFALPDECQNNIAIFLNYEEKVNDSFIFNSTI